MLVNVYHDTRAEHRRLLLCGLVFLVAVGLLIALSIAIYDKAFQTVTTVTIRADRAGLQLERYGDVRVHGVLVGQVRKVDQNGTKAVITVAVSPKSAKEIPENVGVQILPTTLFGQKYISFTDPKHPSSKHLTDGDVIPASRVTTNVELSKILADLFPLLRAVRPADLNSTLNALATALEGRGEQIGQTLVRLDTYLTGIQPHLGTFRKDLVALADVTHTYEVATPDLVRLLRNATVTSRTILDKRQQLSSFFDDVSGLSSTTSRVLADQRGRPDPLRPAVAADAAAPRHLLAGVPLPDEGARPLPGTAAQDLPEQPDLPEARAGGDAEVGLRQERQAGLRRGRARALVPGAALPEGADRPEPAQGRQRQRLEPVAEPAPGHQPRPTRSSSSSAAPGPPAASPAHRVSSTWWRPTWPLAAASR